MSPIAAREGRIVDRRVRRGCRPPSRTEEELLRRGVGGPTALKTMPASPASYFDRSFVRDRLGGVRPAGREARPRTARSSRRTTGRRPASGGGRSTSATRTVHGRGGVDRGQDASDIIAGRGAPGTVRDARRRRVPLGYARRRGAMRSADARHHEPGRAPHPGAVAGSRRAEPARSTPRASAWRERRRARGPRQPRRRSRHVDELGSAAAATRPAACHSLPAAEARGRSTSPRVTILRNAVAD